MKYSKILSFGLCVWMLTACGTQSSNTASTVGSNSTTTTTTVTPTPTPTGNVNNLPGAYQTLVQISGNGGSTPSYAVNSLTTSRTLKVKIAPLAAPKVTGTQWVFPYGCLQVEVTVDGSTQSTNAIPVSGAGLGTSPQCSGPSYQILDFSNVMTGNNLGNGAVSVSIHDPSYDNCRSYYSPYYYGCYMVAMYSAHMAAMNVTIQTDGTWMDP